MYIIKSTTTEHKALFETESEAINWADNQVQKGRFEAYTISSDDPTIKDIEDDRLISKYSHYFDISRSSIVLFTALINERMYTQEQKHLLERNSTIIQIMKKLDFGRLGEALKIMDNIESDEDLFFQEDIDRVKSFIKRKIE